MANSSLVTEENYNVGGHLTYGRQGTKIDRIVLHHNASTSDNIPGVWQNRAASAHYQVTPNAIRQCVDEGNTAWAAGNWAMNLRSINIEHLNSTGAPNWDVADETEERSAALVADICKRHGIPCDRSHIIKHGEVVATACLPINITELLTPSGWKKLFEIARDDLVATYRMDDGEIIFAPVRNVVTPYQASTWEMRHIEATADHRMIWRTQRGSYKVTSLEEMAKSPSQVYIPNAGHYSGAGLDLSDSEIKLLVAIQADGHYMKDKEYPDKPYGIEFHLSKQRKIDLLEDILDELGKEYSVGDRADGSKAVRMYGREEVDWAEKYLSGKQFTWKFLEMDDHQVEVFMDTILDFDGCRAGNDYSSSIEQNIDVVQAIAAIHGTGTRLSGDGKRVYFTSRERSINTHGKLVGNATRRNNQTVGCVTVDTGLILIRQHGRTTIVGNCPGGLDIDKIVRRANEILGGASANIPAAPSTPTVTEPASTGWCYFDYRGNVRQQPTTKSAIMATYNAGTWVEYVGFVHGQTVNGSDKWLKSKIHGWYVHESVTGGTWGLKDLGSVSTGGGKSLDDIANEVLAGKWGNGDDRRNRLQAAGYDYNAVQALVNQKLGVGSAPARKSNEQVADEVIRGEWGNGDERRQRLQAAGYDYNAIQAIVNRKL